MRLLQARDSGRGAPDHSHRSHLLVRALYWWPPDAATAATGATPWAIREAFVPGQRALSAMAFFAAATPEQMLRTAAPWKLRWMTAKTYAELL